MILIFLFKDPKNIIKSITLTTTNDGHIPQRSFKGLGLFVKTH